MVLKYTRITSMKLLDRNKRTVIVMRAPADAKQAEIIAILPKPSREASQSIETLPLCAFA